MIGASYVFPRPTLLRGEPTMADIAKFEALHTELKDLSKAANWPAVDPGTFNMDLSPQMIAALVVVVPNMTQWLSGTVATALKLGILAAQAAGKLDDLKPLITSNIGYITTGVKGLRMAYQGKNLVTGSGDTGSGPPSIIKDGKVSWAATGATYGVDKVKLQYGQGAIAYYDKGDARFHIAMIGGQGVVNATHHEVAQVGPPPVGVAFVTKYRYREATGTLPFYMKKQNLYIAGGVAAIGGLFYILSK